MKYQLNNTSVDPSQDLCVASFNNNEHNDNYFSCELFKHNDLHYIIVKSHEFPRPGSNELAIKSLTDEQAGHIKLMIARDMSNLSPISDYDYIYRLLS